MKKTLRLLAVLLAICAIVCAFVSCNKDEEPTHVDYAASVKLDMNSSTLKLDVTGKVKLYIDGDTTHFYVPKSEAHPDGVLKARYLAVNTPESTGKIEVWGKTASNFTKEKLSSATSIMIESDTDKWDADSTGSRYLVWVWYKTADSEDYRNLNIEILQEGLAIASNSANNIYGDTCMAAIEQAQRELLHVYSSDKDPNFYYDGAQEITIRELRANIDTYNGTKVKFEGVVTKNYNNGVYVESYDAVSDMYNGIYVYYGMGFSGAGMEIIRPGNRVCIVGSVSEFQGTYQVSGIQYREMRPNDPENIKQLDEEVHAPAYVPTTAETFLGTREVEVDDEIMEYSYAELALHSSISISNLKVERTYTTSSDTSSKGDITIYCTVGGKEIVIRTSDLTDDEGNLVNASLFEGKTIDVKGIVDCYISNDGTKTYQIKLLSLDNLTIHQEEQQ